MKTGFRITVPVLLLLATLLPARLQAQLPRPLSAPPPKTPLVPANPVTTASGPGAHPFPVGQFAAEINYSYAQSDGVRFEDHELDNSLQMTWHIADLKFRFGLFPGLDIRSTTPIYSIKEKQPAGSHSLRWLGDTTVIAHMLLATPDDGTGLHLAFDFGGTLPTAQVDNDSYDYLGNHAWGLYAGMEGTWFAGRHRIDQEVNFSSYTEGNHDYTKPDRARVNSSWAYALTETFDWGVEANFEWNGESCKDDIDRDDRMIEWFAGPKLALKAPQQKFLFGAAVLFPLYRAYEPSAGLLRSAGRGGEI